MNHQAQRRRPERMARLGVILAICLCGCQTIERSPRVGGSGSLMAFPRVYDPLTEGSGPAPEPCEPQIIAGEGKSTLIYTSRYTPVEVLRSAVEAFVGIEGTVQTCPQQNSLILTDTPAAVTDLLKIIQGLDHPTPQLLVEARVVEVTLDSDFEYEVNNIYKALAAAAPGVVREAEFKLETPGSTPTPTMGARISLQPWSMDSHQFDLFLRLLVTRGKATILSSPNVIVSLGNEASLITGEELPVQSATVVSGSVSTTTEFKRVGIKLRVTPLQITGDLARLDINPEVSTVTGFTSAGESGVSNPIVSVRSVRTTLSVKNGQIITIGGLLRSEDREVIRQVPGLGDVPGLGWLFRSERKQKVDTQLVFFLQIHILAEGKPGAVSLHKPGAGMEKLDETHAPTSQPASRPADESGGEG